MTDSRKIVLASLNDARQGLQSLCENEVALDAIASAAHAIANGLKSGNKVLSCGNGGSMSDAMHFAEELSGRYRHDRTALAALALSDPSFLTCVANDYGFEHVFSRGIQALGKVGDVLVCFSTSGASKNVIAAATEAKAMGMSIVALTGKIDCPLAKLCDVHICTPAGTFADRVQELHIKVVHIMIELIEFELF